MIPAILHSKNGICILSDFISPHTASSLASSTSTNTIFNSLYSLTLACTILERFYWHISVNADSRGINMTAPKIYSHFTYILKLYVRLLFNGRTSIFSCFLLCHFFRLSIFDSWEKWRLTCRIFIFMHFYEEWWFCRMAKNGEYCTLDFSSMRIFRKVKHDNDRLRIKSYV